MPPTVPPLNLTDITTLPAVVDLGTACRFLGITRSSATELIANERFPVKVLRLGRTYRVSTMALLIAVGHPIPENLRTAA